MSRKVLSLPGLALAAALAFAAMPQIASAQGAQVTAFKQAVAEAAATDDDIAAFYRANGYQPLWTGATDADRARRGALIKALSSAAAHGLPAARSRSR